MEILKNASVKRLVEKAVKAGTSTPSTEQLMTLAVATGNRTAHTFLKNASIKDLTAVKNHIASIVYGKEPESLNSKGGDLFGLDASESNISSEDQKKIYTPEPVEPTTAEQKDIKERNKIPMEEKHPETSDRKTDKEAVAEPLKEKVDSAFKKILDAGDKSPVEKREASKKTASVADEVYDTIMGNVGMSEHHVSFDLDKVEEQQIDGNTISFNYNGKPVTITVQEGIGASKKTASALPENLQKKIDRAKNGEQVLMNDGELSEIENLWKDDDSQDASDFFRFSTTIPNPNQIGTKDQWLMFYKDYNNASKKTASIDAHFQISITDPVNGDTEVGSTYADGSLDDAIAALKAYKPYGAEVGSRYNASITTFISKDYQQQLLASKKTIAQMGMVTNVRKMTGEEMAAQGWDGQAPPAVLEFADGVKIFPSRDSEGNGPGVLFGEDTKGESFYIFGSKEQVATYKKKVGELEPQVDPASISVELSPDEMNQLKELALQDNSGVIEKALKAIEVKTAKLHKKEVRSNMENYVARIKKGEAPSKVLESFFNNVASKRALSSKKFAEMMPGEQIQMNDPTSGPLNITVEQMGKTPDGQPAMIGKTESGETMIIPSGTEITQVVEPQAV